MQYLLLSIVLLFTTISAEATNSIDSSKQILTVHFGKRSLMCYDELNERKGPFKENYIISGSLLFQQQIGHIGSLKVNGFGGLNCRILQAGYTNALRAVAVDSNNYSGGTFMMGLQFGMSIEKKVIAFKKHQIFVSLGFSGTGMVFNSVAYRGGKAIGSDSVSLNFKANRLYYLNPFGQITVKSKIGKYLLAYGIRYLLATDFDETNAEYTVRSKYAPYDYSYRGTFLDNSDQLEFFMGWAV
ncbi:MAG: hypothetical protein V4613_06595 [Bacteroidota bacterium]